MWIFLNDSMISVVQPDAGKPEMLLVRARIRGDLELLALGAPILESLDRDYRFSCLVTRVTVQALMNQVVDEIDYPSFRESIEPDDGPRRAWYHEVWKCGRYIQDSFVRTVGRERHSYGKR